MPPTRHLLLLLAVTACSASDDIPTFPIENSHGKTDNLAGVGLTLSTDAPRAALVFHCEKPMGTCDIRIALHHVDGSNLNDQLRRSTSPEAQKALGGGLFTLLDLELERPDQAIFRGELKGTWNSQTQTIEPMIVFEKLRQPPGDYMVTLQSTLALERAYYVVSADWE